MATLRNHRLTALYDVSRLLNVTLDIEAALVNVLDLAIALTDAERGCVLLREPTSATLTFKTARHKTRQTLPPEAFEFSALVAEQAARSGEGVLTTNAPTNPRFEDREASGALALRSVMAVPLRARGQTLGVLYVDDTLRQHEFTQDDVDLLEAFADQAGVALLNAQLYEEQKREAELNRILLELARAAQNAASVAGLMDNIRESLPRWVGYPAFALLSWDEEARGLRPAYISNPAKAEAFFALGLLPEARLPMTLLREQTTLRLSDLVRTLPHVAEWAAHFDPTHMVLLPLHGGGQFWGLLALDRDTPAERPSPHTMRLFEAVANQLAAAIQRLNLFATAERQVRELRVLHEVGLVATTATTEDQLISQALAILQKRLNVPSLGVALYDPATECLVSHPASIIGGQPLSRPLTTSLAQGVIGQVARTGQAVRSGRVQELPCYNAVNPDTQSELCVPLKVGERLLGVINLESPQVDFFTAHDEQLLLTLAGQMATALEKLRLLVTERQQREMAEALRDMASSLNVNLRLEVVMGRIVPHLSRVVPCDAAVILQLDASGARVRVASSFGYDAYGDDLLRAVTTLDLPLAEAPNLLWMRDHNQPLFIQDISALTPPWPDAGYFRAWVGTPIYVQDQLIGFISLVKREADFYNEEHARRLAAFAGQVGLALQNAQLYAQSESRALELAQLYNATQRQLDELRILHTLASLAAELTSANTLIGRATELLGYVLHPIAYGVLLLDESGLVLHPHASAVNMRPGPFVVGEGLIGGAALTGQRMQSNRLNRADLPEAHPSAQAQMCVPIKINGQVAGVLNVELARANAFTPADERLLTTFAGQLAVALEKARLFELECIARQQAETLRDVANRLNLTNDPATLFQLILDQMQRLVQYDSASVMLREGNILRVVAHGGFWPEDMPEQLNIEELTHLQEMLADRRPMLITDTATDPRWRRYGQVRARCWLGVPLIVDENRTIGVLNLDKFTPGAYTNQDAELALTLGYQAAIAIERLQLLDHTQRLLADTQQRESELQTLLQVASLLSTRLRLSEVIEQVAQAAAEAIKMDVVSVSLYDPRERVVRALYTYAPNPALLNTHSAELGYPYRLDDYPLTARALENTEVIIIRAHDPAADPNERALLEKMNLAVLLMLSMRVGGRVVGLMELYSVSANRTFTPGDLRLARAIADQGGVAVETARLYTDLETEKRRLELLYNLSQNLASTLDPREVALRALDLIYTNLKVFRAQLYAFVPEANHLRLLALAGYHPHLESLLEDLALPLGQGLAGQAALTRQPLFSPNVHQDPRWLPHLADEHVESAVALPLLRGGRLLGVLSLLSNETNFFDESQLPLWLAACASVSLALQNAREFELEKRRVQALTELHETSLELSTLVDAAAIAQVVLERATHALDTHGGLLYLTTPTPPGLQLAAHYQVDASYPPLPTDRPNGLSQYVAQSEQGLIINDYANWPRRTPGLEAKATLAVPIKWHGQLLGVLNLLEQQRINRFYANDLDILQLFADQAAVALENSRLYAELNEEKRGLETLYTLSRSLSTILIPREAGLRALSLICQRLNIPQAVIYIADRAGGYLRLLCLFGYPDERAAHEAYELVSIDHGPGVTSYVARHHQLLLIPDVQADPRWVTWPVLDDNVRSACIVPLMVGDTLIAVMNLLSDQVNGFREENRRLLEAMSVPVALALQNATLFEAETTRVRHLALLNRITRLALDTDDLRQVLQKMVDEIGPTQQAEHCLITLWDEAEGRTRPATAYGPLREVYPTLTVDPQEPSFTQAVLERGHWWQTDQVQPYALYRVIKNLRSALAFPLIASGQKLGALIFAYESAAFVTQEDIQRIGQLADQVALTIAKVTLLEERTSLLRTLEARVIERTRELAQANERLKELDKLKDHFVANVSHELRTPLTAIKIHLSLLEKRGAELLPKYLPVLQRETERLRRLIEDLLEVTRIRETRQTQPAPHMLADIMHEVLALHIPRLEQRNLTLHHIPPAKPVPVILDRAQMMQVLTNILGNAVSYTPAGGAVTISYATGQPPHLAQVGEIVRVHNTGTYIPPEDMRNLFTRFYRGKTGRDSGAPGTGLGLSICREIMERHQGHIWAESHPETGTAFLVWLPHTPPK